MAPLRFAMRACALAFATMLSLSPASAAGEKIRLGWTSWADAEAASMIAERMLRDLGYDVEMVFDNIGKVYDGMADGSLDIMLMSWQPAQTHHLERHNHVFEDLGVVYGKAQNGWVVPSYVPASLLSSFDDLRKPEVKRQLRGRIVGIDEGAGMMEHLRKAMVDYDLGGYTIVYGNEVSSIAAIRRAVQEKKWVMAATWRPHWVFAEWDLRFVEDPKRIVSVEETVHILGRPGFSEAHPKAAKFLAGFDIPLSELQAVMLRGTKVLLDQAVTEYLNANPERVRGWLANAQ